MPKSDFSHHQCNQKTETHAFRKLRRASWVQRGNPLFVYIGEPNQRLRKSGLRFAFGGWEIQRSYSEEELARAQLFLLKVPFTELPDGVTAFGGLPALWWLAAAIRLIIRSEKVPNWERIRDRPPIGAS